MARMLWAVMATVLVHGAQADPDASKWNVDQVCQWARKARLGNDVVESLRALGVDGMTLLHMEVKDIKEDLGITDANLVLKMHSAIEELEDHFTHKPKLNFWQYRSLNRNAMDSFVPGISGLAPRFALRILYEFPAAGQPSEPEGWITWLFCPQYYIFMNADKIVGGLPFLVKCACLTSLIGQILTLFVLTSLIGLLLEDFVRRVLLEDFVGESCWKILFGVSGKAGESCWKILFGLTVGLEIVVAIVIEVYRWLIYPIIPWIISDCIFYFNVYVTSCIVVAKSFSLLFLIGAVALFFGARSTH